MTREAIEAVTGPLGVGSAESPAAPGTLESHYAPRAVVIAVEPAELAVVLPTMRGKVGVLAPRSALKVVPDGIVVQELPEDVAGMARDLYASLRSLDETGVDVVVAALPPAVGLGEAVGDRLLRAAGPRRKP
jgi:L-threonylcarbamoyladenylate synthase